MTARTTTAPAGWPEGVRAVQYQSPADGTMQSTLFYAPESQQPVPLLVALHLWQGDFTQPSGVPYAEWAIAHGWAMVHPDFRGPNRRPEATGSDLVVADILAAVTYAKAHARIDNTRVYLMGGSGGGHAALLLAGRAPKTWAAVSVWSPIVDLRDWYEDLVGPHAEPDAYLYQEMIVASCGGAPGTTKEIDKQYERRSPATFLRKAIGLPIDINSGIDDGHIGAGPVPVRHSFRAFEILANSGQRLANDEIESIADRADIPASLRFQGQDPSYGDHVVLFRRESNNVRVTLFKGGHEILFRPGLEWLMRQRQGSASVWR